MTSGQRPAPKGTTSVTTAARLLGAGSPYGGHDPSLATTPLRSQDDAVR